MIYRKPRNDEKGSFDRLAGHPLQSWAWGDFRQKTGVDVERLAFFDGSKMVSQMQVTFHPIPKIGYTIGYYPKGMWPDEIQLTALRDLGQRKKALFIKMEPDVSAPPKSQDDLLGLKDFLVHNGCQQGRSMFTPHSFIIDLNQTEEELLAAMKSKTRYNIRVAQKHGIEIIEDSTDAGFQDYLALLEKTTKRQKFYAHTKKYQEDMWATMHQAGIARILKATYQGETLSAWVLFAFNHTFYYPYGASSREHRDKMPSNLLMWEAIKLGQRLNCRTFDLWGSLGPEPDKKDPWYGFHRFKEGYGGDLAEFVGTYDLIIDPNLYKLYRIADRWRWRYLRIRKFLPF